MHCSERGFSLVEAMVAVALTTGVMLAVTAAVTNSLHGSAREVTKIALRDDALSALADLRASTAYDGGLMRRMAGNTSTLTIKHPNAPDETITIVVSAAPSSATFHIVAIATATEDTASVTEQRTLYNEAPAPGSTVHH